MKKASFLILAASLAACGSQTHEAVIPGGAYYGLQKTAGAPAGHYEHLYVSDASSHKVLRFPMLDGIPAAKPDAEIGGFAANREIAIGPDSRLYVVDKGTRQLLIFNPKPGSTSTPVATVSLSGRSGLGTVAVDPLGYVYIGWENVCTTEGFYCGNFDVFSPFAKGLKLVNSVLLGGGGGGVAAEEVGGLAVDKSQLLAAENEMLPPNVYTHAPFVQSFYTIFCGGANDRAVTWGPSHLLYVTDLGSSNPPSPAQVVVITQIVSGCPAYYTITSATTPIDNPLGIAADEARIYVTSAFNSNAGSAMVFVLDPSKSGNQTPLFILEGKATELNDPRGIAIGP